MFRDFLTGHVKLSSGSRSRPRGSVRLKEPRPRTGVMTRPKIQSPGDTTVWKFFMHTEKKVLQSDPQLSPLDSKPPLFSN